MNSQELFEEYKRKEFIGDAVYSVVAREIICNNSENRFSKQSLAADVCSNIFMAKIAKKINLIVPSFDDNPYLLKRFANALEVHVYELYNQYGFDAVRNWFKLEVVPEINFIYSNETPLLPPQE